MPLISITLPDQACTTALALLDRIATALERIAGPVETYVPPTQATFKDYAVVTPEDADRVRLAHEDFARQNMLIPGSEAYLKAIGQFEAMVEESFGPEAVDNLPWRIPTGVPPSQGLG